MKYCSRCKQWKSLIEFNKNKTLEKEAQGK